MPHITLSKPKVDGRRTPLLTILLGRYKWGSWCLVSLYISILSGIIVGLQYDPAEPFFSVTSMDLLVPYGAYFRSLHFYSSQAFFLFAVIHFIAVWDKSESLSLPKWTYLVLTLPTALILLFTGYVLRGDNTGFSAGMIAEAILHTIPVVGTLLDEMLFSISEIGMTRVYVHHVISLDFLLLVLAWDHLRRYRVRITDHLAFICIVLCFSIFVAAPLEPEKLGTTYISGPWFFLGLQELLRYLPPLLAGVIIPLALLIAVAYCKRDHRYILLTVLFIAGWLLAYLVLTLIAWNR